MRPLAILPLCAAAHAATITLQSDPIRIGTGLVGDFTATVTDGALSATFRKTGGLWALPMFMPITGRFTGLTDLSAMQPNQQYPFAWTELLIGGFLHLGPGSSHPVMGYSRLNGAQAELLLWQDAATTNGIVYPTSGDLRLRAYQVADVPEPASLWLLGAGLGAWRLWRRRA